MTRLLAAVDRGDRQAAAHLLPLVYADLRQLAAARVAGQAAGYTLDATALVHEAYLRVVGPGDGPGGPFLRRRRRGHAAHPRRPGPPPHGPQAGRGGRPRTPPRGRP